MGFQTVDLSDTKKGGPKLGENPTLEEIAALAKGGGSDDDDLVVEQADEDDGDIVIVDDAPPEDQGRDRADLNASDDDDISDEELKKIGSAIAQKRISSLTKQKHDLRRTAEDADRKSAVAIDYARKVYEHSKKLEEQLKAVSTGAIDVHKAAAASRVTAATQMVKDAQEAGDTEAFAKASLELNRAVVEETIARGARPVEAAAAPAPPQMQQLDPRTKEWMDKNTWFATDQGLHIEAMAKSERAKLKGLTPGSEAYYTFIDAEMKPHLVAAGLASGTDQRNNPPKTRTQVTPVSRNAGAAKPEQNRTASNKVTLTRSEVEMAASLGLSPTQYARGKLALERNGQ